MPGCSRNAAWSEASAAVEAAVAALRRGALVVYPTETLYGLGADATNRDALAALVRLKGRPAGKPIGVLVAGREMLGALVAQVDRAAAALIERFWPGPLTLVLPALPSVPAELTGGTGTVGVRQSSHPIAARLVELLGAPVTCPSANPAGAEPPTTVGRARSYFGDAVSVYVDGGPVPGGGGSTVFTLVGEPRVLRRGPVPEQAIFEVLRAG